MTDGPARTEGSDYWDPQQYELLTAWRNERIHSIGKPRLAQIAAAVFRQIRAHAIDVPEDLGLRAHAGDPTAWVRIADIVSAGSDFCAEDREASCLLVASAQGSKWASMILTLRLAQAKVEDVDPEVRSANFRTLTSRFYLHGVAPHSVAMSLGVRVEFAKGIEVEKPPDEKKSDELLPETPKEPTNSSPPVEPAGPTLRVLLQKLVASTDKSLNALLDTFGRIDGHVPLVGSPNPRELARQLLAEFPWALGVTQEIEMQLALDRRLGGDTFRMPPTILVGPSGSGKSRFARRLGELANLPATILQAGGATDNRTLGGTPRGWASSTPSFPLETIRRARIANPLIVVEEIDKAGGSDRNGRLADTLLAMLDPVLSARWLDECLQVEADISRISWVLTANRLDRIPPALRARCRIIAFPPPRARDFDILFAGILSDLAESYCIDVDALPTLAVDLVERLRTGFSTGRLTARQLSQLVRRTLALQTIADSITPVH